MADQSLNDFFAGTRLTQVAQSAAIKRGVPRTIPGDFFTPSATKPTSDQVEYIQYSGNRAGAQLVNRMSPARAVTQPGATRKYATALNVKEKFPLHIEMIQALKSDIPMIRLNAQQHLARQMMDFNVRFETTRTNIVTSLFANRGKWYADSDGNVLPTSSGAKLTYDAGCTSATQLTTDGASSTYAIGDWATASTAIQTKLTALRKAVLKATGYNPTTVLYGENVPEYLQKNTTLKEYFSRNQMFRDRIVQNNEIPDGTLGYNWKPVNTAFHVGADNSTVTEWFGGDYIGVVPDVSDDWYEFVEGGNLYPLGISNPGMGMEQMLSLCGIANGKYAFAEMTMDPISVNLINGDSFVPILKVPALLYSGVCH